MHSLNLTVGVRLWVFLQTLMKRKKLNCTAVVMMKTMKPMSHDCHPLKVVISSYQPIGFSPTNEAQVSDLNEEEATQLVRDCREAAFQRDNCNSDLPG